jgi:hypothetical protein
MPLPEYGLDEFAYCAACLRLRGSRGCLQNDIFPGPGRMVSGD